MDNATHSAPKQKVFISYSRADVAGADELELALSDKGFEVLIDRHGILPGEDWRSRLSDLLLSCDTVLFLLSDSSAASETCHWEVEEATRLGKRLLVATIGPTASDVEPPSQLSGINWIHCWPNPALPGSGLIRGVLELEQALNTDFEWLRERTTYQEQARRWAIRVKQKGEDGSSSNASSLLLRGDGVAEALDWARKIPPSETIPEEINRFFDASEQHEQELQALTRTNVEEREFALKSAERAQTRLKRFSSFALIVGLVLTLISSAGGYLAWINFQNAQEQTQLALDNQERARAQSMIAARKSSDLLAMASKDLLQSPDTPEQALLMALQADPLNQKLGRAEADAPQIINDLALARLRAANANLSLVHLIQSEGTEIREAAFSGDGETILTGHEDGSIAIWDTLTGELRVSKSEHTDSIRSIASSPNGSFFATGDVDGVTHVWRASDGEMIARFAGNEQNAPWITAIGFDANAEHIVIGKRNGEVLVASPLSEQELRSISNPGEVILDVALSPDGNYIASASGAGPIGTDDFRIRVWELITGQLIWEFDNYESRPTSLFFSQDGSRLGVGTYGPVRQYWDFEDGGTLKDDNSNIKWEHYPYHSPDEPLRLTINAGKVRVWNRTNESPVLSDPPLPARLRVVSPDGKHLALSNGDEMIVLLDAITLQEVSRLQMDSNLIRSPGIDQIGYSADGTSLFAATNRGLLWWDVNTGALLKSLSEEESFVSVAQSTEGGLVAGVEFRGPAHIWADGGQTLVSTIQPEDETIRIVAVSPDGESIVTGDSNGAVIFRDPLTGDVQHSISAHDSEVRSIAFSPNGELFVTASNDPEIKVWDGATKSQSYTLTLRFSVRPELSIQEWNGQLYLASPSDTHTATIWDLRTGEAIMEKENPGSLGMQAALFVPNTNRFITVHGAGDEEIARWTLPDSIFSSPTELFASACSKLERTKSPMSFSQEDGQIYRVLAGEPINSETGDFISPCDRFDSTKPAN
ncbi:MAG: TIR domain-containing protein [Pseudomonadota bacterium]